MYDAINYLPRGNSRDPKGAHMRKRIGHAHAIPDKKGA